jgi:cobalamin biosynthesis Mg chelatase CobN
MLAVLALALFPVLAHAENSSGTVYEPEVPAIEAQVTKVHKVNSTHPNSTNKNASEGSAAHASKAEGKSSEKPEESGSEGHKKKTAGGAASSGEGNPPKGGGGGEGSGTSKSGSTGSESGISGRQEVAGTPASEAVSESSGGSSPLVPILIIVVALAAISIGVVLYRQRKSGEDPDSRISSPNAS